METYTTYIRFRLRVNASGELRREFQDWSSLLFFLTSSLKKYVFYN